jgi:endo-1,4-beta-xylanase
LEQLYRLFYGHPSVASINYWGMSDRNIWIESAGLIDKEYRPKPVFTVLKKLIKGEWLTPDFTARTDAAGCITFQGFYGEYEVVVKRPGQRFITYRVHLSELAENTPVLTI